MIGVLRSYGILVLGLVGLVTGAILLARPPQASFGWTAYAPLSNTTYVPPSVAPAFSLGVAFLAIGIALTAGWIGYRFGRLRRA